MTLRLRREFPRSSLPELASDRSPKSWSLESRQLAITRGYLNGNLKGGTHAADAPPLPGNYLTAAKAVAQRQAALAGYRLAAQIEEYAKAAGPVPRLPNANAQSAPAKLPAVIAAADAAKYYNENMTLTGRVAQVTVRPTVIFLNLDKRYPHSPLTAVIFRDNAGKFGDVKRFEGRDVMIKGTIAEYRSWPEIILTSADQLKAR